MADNLTTQSATPATVPASTVIATDDAGAGGHVQVVKLAISTNGSATPLTADNTDGLLVNLGTNNDVTISDGGNTITVDGTVTVNALPAGTNNIGDVDILSIAAGDNNIGNVDVVSSALPTGAATSAKQDTEITALQAIQAAVETLDNTVGGSELQVDVVGALPAGNNNIGDVDVASIATGDNNIGNVDIVTMPNVTLAAGTNTNEVVGDVAHDAGAAGNPVLVAGIATNMDDTAPPNRVSAENDATRIVTDWDGAVYAHPHGPQVWTYHLDTSTAQTDTEVHAASGSASLCLYVTDIVFSHDGTAAINLFFEETTNKRLGPFYLPATAGGVKLHFGTPKKLTANTALTLTTSASHAHSVDVTGFTGQG
jgi:hypothetical protein